MKRILQPITLALVLSLMFSVAGFAQFQAQKADSPVTFIMEKDDEGEWIHWDDGTFATSIGTDGAAQFDVASRWEPSDLEAYDGMAITKVSFFPVVASAEYTIKIWEGADKTEVYAQLVENFEVGEINTVELETAYIIDASDELMFGYYIDTPEGYPAGAAAGPAIVMKGDVLRLGADWVSMYEAYGLDYNWIIQAYVVSDDDPEGFEVTFNVDMGPAEGFDPNEHSVFITGNFAGWAEPGTEGSIEMEWAGKAKTVETILYENFDGGAIPDGWLNLDEDGDGFKWDIVTTPGHQPYDGDYAVISESWKAGTILNPDNWLITPRLFGVTDDWELSWAVKAQDADWPHEKYDVLISTTDPDPDEFTSIYSETLEDNEWEVHTLSLADFAGESIYIAFRHYDSSDWFQMVLDAIEVTGTPGDVPEELIYTATVPGIEAGEIEYKYFSDAFGDGWAGGEWEGDPNRTADITGDTVINDKWGDLVTSIVDAEVTESLLSLFPNPATSVITVESSSVIKEVRVFDITGRMVMQRKVDASSAVMDISTLRTGMYIMQVQTSEGVEGRRFHVAR